jgi:hypothetical protein
MTSQAMAPAAFFYYSPDPNAEHRQHGHFIPQQPHPQQHQMPMYPVVPVLPSTPIYSRPNSACSQPMPVHKPFTSLPSNITPVASPQPLAHRPTIVLETETQYCETDGIYYPSTPPLSTSGSVISSPGSCDVLATPLNPMFSGLDGFEGTKTEDSQVEKFPVLDWSSCTSPPLTPVYLQSQQHIQPAKFSLNSTSINTPSDLLSSTASCPSLSPSPVPQNRTVNSTIDFCDPRNLTVGIAPSTTLPHGFPELPTLCAGDDEEHKIVLRGEAPAFSQNSCSFDFGVEHPNFDEISELGSEEDFVNGLVDLSEQSANPASRSRASSDALSLGTESYTDLDVFDEDEAFSVHSLPSPASSCSDSDCHQAKRQKTMNGPVMTLVADSQTASEQQQQSEEQNNSEERNGDDDKKTPPSGSPETTTPMSTPAPANRRGRKQSLTEDPSKTFVCDICNRRFRRQEHLKRHYRSLHTADKPFECNECGKKFSRSDNLAQHARTHGTGAIVMNLIEGHENLAAAGAYQQMYPAVNMDEYQSLGKVLFQVAAEIPGSASDMSSDDGDSNGKKKRKRMD